MIFSKKTSSENLITMTTLVSQHGVVSSSLQFLVADNNSIWKLLCSCHVAAAELRLPSSSSSSNYSPARRQRHQRRSGGSSRHKAAATRCCSDHGSKRPRQAQNLRSQELQHNPLAPPKAIQAKHASNNQQGLVEMNFQNCQLYQKQEILCEIKYIG